MPCPRGCDILRPVSRLGRTQWPQVEFKQSDALEPLPVTAQSNTVIRRRPEPGRESEHPPARSTEATSRAESALHPSCEQTNLYPCSSPSDEDMIYLRVATRVFVANLPPASSLAAGTWQGACHSNGGISWVASPS
ncbi:hypothetical protein BaRGS_00018080 [Batillaria attramentaria]|uniref:Uncharacterized protein n=1 Tax=Batillaria attramentaria TaxID=370345 RepID=A0ABD0KUC5_9CAEN